MNKRSLRFSGTHKEIGEQVGELYRKWGHDYSRTPAFVDTYPEQLKIYDRFFPKYIELLEGVAQGLKIDKDKLLKFSLTIFLSVAKEFAEKKCSAFALSNQQGIFVGRNYDWLSSSEKYSQLLHFIFPDKSSYNFSGISDMGTWKPFLKVNQSSLVLITEDAWNEKGLYIGLNGAPGKKTGLGMTSPHVVQCIAEACKDVNEAVELLKKIPTTNSHIFTLADKSRNLAVVEKSLEKGVFVRNAKDFIIATNHFNHPTLISENRQIFNKVPFHSTFARYHYLESNLIKNWKDMNQSLTIDLLSKPPTLQNWRNEDVITVWIVSLDLSKGKYKIKFLPLQNKSILLEN